VRSCAREKLLDSYDAKEPHLRPLIITAAGVVALAAVALGRLGQTLGQITAIEVPSPPATFSAVDESGTRQVASDAVQSQLATLTPFADVDADAGNEPPVHSTNDEEPAIAASSGDEHIMRALVQNPDFMRAAEELLQDPDPQTQQEARLLLRELGALDER
jgi:hypothetical protein